MFPAGLPSATTAILPATAPLPGPPPDISEADPPLSGTATATSATPPLPVSPSLIFPLSLPRRKPARYRSGRHRHPRPSHHRQRWCRPGRPATKTTPDLSPAGTGLADNGSAVNDITVIAVFPVYVADSRRHICRSADSGTPVAGGRSCRGKNARTYRSPDHDGMGNGIPRTVVHLPSAHQTAICRHTGQGGPSVSGCSPVSVIPVRCCRQYFRLSLFHNGRHDGCR